MRVAGAFILAVVCLSGGESGGQIVPASRPSGVNYFSFGVQLGSPEAWQQLPADKLDMIARWISPHSQPGDLQGMIVVEMKKTDAGARQNAREIAKSWGGEVSDTEESLGGERAVMIQSNAHGTGLQPNEGLMAVHEGRLYIITGGVKPGFSCHDAIEEIRASWKWTKMEAPARHLEFCDKPLAALDGKTMINYPAVVNLFDTGGRPDQSLGLEIFNYVAGASEFQAIVQMGAFAPGLDFDLAKDKVGKGVQDKFKLAEAFAWHDVASAKRGAVTQAVMIPSDNDHDAYWIMWGLVSLDEKRFVLINYSIFTKDAGDREEYVKTAGKIAESIVVQAGAAH
jgi:hypothetical protein